MNIKKRLCIYISLLIIALITMFLLWRTGTKVRDYPEISQEGILRVVTDYNSVGYYISGDSVLGTQYELCKSIEKQSGLIVEIHLENSLEKSIQGLQQSQYDVIARNIPITTETKEMIAFTNPINSNKQVLVQRIPSYNNEIPLIKNQIDLAKKTLYVTENSPNILRIQNLSEEIADTIYIKEIAAYNSEQLIYLVAHGDIDYAVVEKEIAQINKKNFPQIDINTDISFTQLQAWAVRKNTPVLLDSLNHWLKEAIP